ncbi:MAG: cadherin-like domain-containing protein, partial [Candidatus Latescibacteria bacterium]|nr:cadherin-like domain-containing protein [Candidatus Latescibacterota bacterium]
MKILSALLVSVSVAGPAFPSAPVAGSHYELTGTTSVVDGQAVAFVPASGSSGRGVKSGTGFAQSEQKISIDTNSEDAGFTLESWILPRSNSAPTHDYLFNTHTADFRDVRVIVENCSELQFSFWDNNNGTPGRGSEHILYASGLNCDRWSHVAATYDGSTMKLYVDQILIGSKSAVGGMLINDNTQIGGWSNASERFTGDIDEVRIWNRALDADELAEYGDSELSGAEPNLVQYLRFNIEDSLSIGGYSFVTELASLSVTTSPGQPISIPLLGTDWENDPLTYALVDMPTQGEASLSNSTVLYTPNQGYAGLDSISYSVSDAEGTSGSAFVRITVSAPVQANRDPVLSPIGARAIVQGSQLSFSLTASDED